MLVESVHKVTISLTDIVVAFLPKIANVTAAEVGLEDVEAVYDHVAGQLVITFDSAWEGDAEEAEEYPNEVELEEGQALRHVCDFNPPANWPGRGDKVQLELTTGETLAARVVSEDGDGDLRVVLGLDVNQASGLVRNDAAEDLDYHDDYDGPERLQWATERVAKVRW